MLKTITKTIFAVLAASVIALGVYSPAHAFDGGLGLSQTNAVLGIGQSISVISFGGNNLKASSSSKAVKASIYGGNQITLVGKQVGTADVRICKPDFCEFIRVTVQRKKTAPFKLAQSKVTVKAGQTISIGSSGGNNIIALSNSNNASAVVNGSKILLTGMFSGKATITVCSGNNGCLPIYVTVSGTSATPSSYYYQQQPHVNNYGSYGFALSLSETNVSLSNQTTKDIYASSNNGLVAFSNSTNVRTAVNGNRVTLYATYVGESIVKICDRTLSCASVNVKVAAPKTGTFQVAQTNVKFESGQSVWINTIFGQNITAQSDSWFVTATVTNNQILIKGTYPGNAVITVCSLSVRCLPIYVTVTQPPQSSNLTGTAGTLYIDIGETENYTFTTNLYRSYYMTNNTNPDSVSASLNDRSITVTGLRPGVATIRICALEPTNLCGTVVVKVSNNYYYNRASGSLQLSVSSITLRNQKTIDLTASSNNGLVVFSDSDAVRGVANGNRITLYGMYPGTAKVTVCDQKFSCASVSVQIISN